MPTLMSTVRKMLSMAEIKPKDIVYDLGSGDGRIIITAACPQIPPPLVEQLKEGGLIVAPVGSLVGQKMIQGRKVEGKLIERSLGYFMFVPLKGKWGY